MKKPTIRTFTPISAVAAVFGLAASSANAQNVFTANFPASWAGTGTVVTDQGTPSNTGAMTGSTRNYSTTAVPSWAAAGTGSLDLPSRTAGGIKVTPDQLLNNAAVLSAGGFTYNIDFLWNGTDSTQFTHIQKLIDYAGTESLQLVTTASGTATLEMTMNASDNSTVGNEQVVASTTINQNTWYDVSMRFNVSGQVGSDPVGIASLLIDTTGSNPTLVSAGSGMKGQYGDDYNRPIAIGEFGYGVSTSLIGLAGDIYSAQILLGAIPEPSTVALGALGGFAALLLRRRKS
ncbi:MAG TPA: PEP-CTERM sorting domain-containing protein [Candidatus Acidoferrum sp.]|nr:PEP-CTERM sorting domain-containing protein [Candidatus Acidoferrum sp.]